MNQDEANLILGLAREALSYREEAISHLPESEIAEAQRYIDLGYSAIAENEKLIRAAQSIKEELEDAGQQITLALQTSGSAASSIQAHLNHCSHLFGIGQGIRRILFSIR